MSTKPLIYPNNLEINDYLEVLVNKYPFSPRLNLENKESITSKNNDILLLPIYEKNKISNSKVMEVKVPEHIFVEWDLLCIISDSIGLYYLYDDFIERNIQISSQEIKKFYKENYDNEFDKIFGKDAIYYTIYLRKGVKLKETRDLDKLWIININKFNEMINDFKNENIRKYGEAFSHPWRKYLYEDFDY